MDRPKMFDHVLEGKQIGDRLKYLGDYLNEVSDDFPTSLEWLHRWENVRQYLLWLGIEG